MTASWALPQHGHLGRHLACHQEATHCPCDPLDTTFQPTQHSASTQQSLQGRQRRLGLSRGGDNHRHREEVRKQPVFIKASQSERHVGGHASTECPLGGRLSASWHPQRAEFCQRTSTSLLKNRDPQQ